LKKSNKDEGSGFIGEGIVAILGGIGAHKLLIGVETLVLGDSLGFIGWCGVAIFHTTLVLKAAGSAINMYSMIRDAVVSAADAKRKRDAEEDSETVTVKGDFHR